MATKRMYRPRKAKKRFSPQEKLSYHTSRDLSPSRYGIKAGSAKHLYSFGFINGFSGLNNASGVEGKFGKKAASGYRFGYARGEKEAYKDMMGKYPLPKEKPAKKKVNKRPPKKDGYFKMIRDMEDRKRDLFADDFARDSKGRIKGSYTPDGFFEPD